MEPAIRVEGLGKRYRIGVLDEAPDTLVGTVTSWLRAPATNFRRLRRLTRFDDGDAHDVLWALRDLSFEVPVGEVWGIVGQNGAGKSTLLKILSRITPPSVGRAWLHGRVASLLEVGTGFHPELTGRENIYLNGTVLGMSNAEVTAAFDEIVEFAEVARFIDTPVKRYSSGMTVRLAFAVAAHLRAEILLVDEVLAVGDLAFQRKCLGKMEDVAAGGRTVIMVSHNMASIRRLCQRGLLLSGGRVARIGPIEDVVDDYFAGALATGGEDMALETRLFRIDRVSVAAVDRPVIQTRDAVEVRMAVTALREIRRPGIYVAFLGPDHVRIAGLNLLDLTGLESIPAGERRELGFRIDDFPLMPGHYHLELYVKDMDIPTIEKVDRWFPFDVVESTVYGEITPDRWHGQVALDATPIVEEGR